MTNPKPKSLGQIAYEADKGKNFFIPWAEKYPFEQQYYERVAQVVAREVKRRLRAKAKTSTT